MLHSSVCFQIEWNMTVVTVFISVMDQTVFSLVQKIERKSIKDDHIPFDLEWNGDLLLVSVPTEGMFVVNCNECLQESVNILA